MLKSFLIMAINKVSAVYRIELDNLYSIDKIYRFNIIYIYIYIFKAKYNCFYNFLCLVIQRERERERKSSFMYEIKVNGYSVT
jgi:hypothetical protein